ncbi:MAG: zinc ribbon domain-containing protein [Phycisphaerales bacterium]|nr:zinc ribbon domain-containing protein [Phycisphaerales bacterium]
MALERRSEVRFKAPVNPDPLPLEPIEEKPRPTLRPCPTCGHGIRPDAVLCVACGYNLASGVRVLGEAGAEPIPPVPCANCGYDVRGLKSERCPECGEPLTTMLISGQGPVQVIRPSAQKKPRRSELQVWLGWNGDVDTASLVRPALVFGVAGLLIGVLMIRAGLSRSALVCGLGALAAMPLGLIGHWILAQVWFGVDAPLKLLALQVGAVSFAMSALAMLFGVPPPMIMGSPVLMVGLHWVAIVLMMFSTMDNDGFDFAISAVPITLAGLAGPIFLPWFL